MKLAPHWRMLIGLALGAGAGIAVNLIAPGSPAVEWVVSNLAEPTGEIFKGCSVPVALTTSWMFPWLTVAWITWGFSGGGTKYF